MGDKISDILADKMSSSSSQGSKIEKRLSPESLKFLCRLNVEYRSHNVPSLPNDVYKNYLEKPKSTAQETLKHLLYVTFHATCNTTPHLTTCTFNVHLVDFDRNTLSHPTVFDFACAYSEDRHLMQ